MANQTNSLAHTKWVGERRYGPVRMIATLWGTSETVMAMQCLLQSLECEVRALKYL